MELKPFRTSINTSFLFFWGAVFFAPLPLILAGLGTRSLIFGCLMGAAGTIAAFLNLNLFLQIFALLLPIEGALNSFMGMQPFSPSMPYLFAGVLVFCGQLRQSEHPSQKSQIPNFVLQWFVVICLSALYSVVLLAPHVLNPTRLLYETPWAKINFGHAVGWMYFYFSQWLCGFLLLTLILSSKDPRSTIQKIIESIFTGLILTAFFAVAQYAGYGNLNNSDKFNISGYISRINASFSDPNSLGLFVAGYLPLWLALLHLNIEKKALWIGVATLPFLIIVSGVRSAFLFMVVVLALYSLYSLIRWKLSSLLIIGFLFVMTLGSVQQIKKRFQDGWRFGKWASTLSKTIAGQIPAEPEPTFPPVSVPPIEPGPATPAAPSVQPTLVSIEKPADSFVQRLRSHAVLGDRPKLWKAGLVTFKHNWPFGVGVGRYLYIMPGYASEIGVVSNDNCCNMLIQIMAEQGIIGLISFLILIFGLFHRTGLKFWLLEDLTFGAFSSFTGFLASFAFGAHLLNYEINMLFWIVAAVLLLDHNPGESTRMFRTENK